MIAPNGDHPGSHRTAHPQVISIAAPLHQKSHSTVNDLFPAVASDPDLTLIYALLGGTVTLLLFALAWSLIN